LETDCNIKVHLSNAGLNVFYNALLSVFLGIRQHIWVMLSCWFTEADLDETISFDIWRTLSPLKLRAEYTSKVYSLMCTGVYFDCQWSCHDMYRYSNFRCATPLSQYSVARMSLSRATRLKDAKEFSFTWSYSLPKTAVSIWDSFVCCRNICLKFTKKCSNCSAWCYTPNPCSGQAKLLWHRCFFEHGIWIIWQTTLV